jgi:hypothetical protein
MNQAEKKLICKLQKCLLSEFQIHNMSTFNIQEKTLAALCTPSNVRKTGNTQTIYKPKANFK